MNKSDDIKRNSTNIWLAGLGAYALIEEQGTEAFDALIEKGRAFENLYQKKIPATAPDSRLDDFKVKANQTMDRIEKAFDMRVSSALGRLGISHKSDLEQLDEKISRIEAALDKLSADLSCNRED